MKIRYLGHASFEIMLEDGRKVVFDPYESGAFDGAVGYSPIEGDFDIALVSHDHADHACEKIISRSKRVFDSPGEFREGDIEVNMISTFHDESGGGERGSNLVTIVNLEGIKLAHLGDLGHIPSPEVYEHLKNVDILFIPVGGHFTIDDHAAAEIVNYINPKIVIPMHFKTDKVGFPLKTVDEFTQRMNNVEMTGDSEITVTVDELTDKMRVVVLDPAL